MKKFTCVILIFIFVFFSFLKAQDTYFTPIKTVSTADSIQANVTDTANILASPISTGNSYALNNTLSNPQDTVGLPDKYEWKIDPRSGTRTLITNMNKTLLNFHQSSLMDGQGVAVGYLGNLGSPAQSKIFFERKEGGLFPFLNAFDYYYTSAEEKTYINTKIPYSNIHYQSGGGRMNKEERLKTELYSNFGKRFNLGFDIDYVYSRGFYDYLSNKQVNYSLTSSYIGERYQMHAYFSHNYYNNSENGGILDDRYITDPTNPALVNLGENSGSKEIPTLYQRMWNRLKGRQLFISNKYDVGYDADKGTEEFIPVASFVLTTYYQDQQRRFASLDQRTVGNNTETYTDSIYGNNNYLTGENGINMYAEDQMAYWSLKNTFAVSLNEGFKDWVKFGLTAFIEQEFRKFSLPSSEFSFPMVTSVHSQNSTVIGGILSKQQGRLLRYNLTADFGLLGYNLGEIRASGDISTTIRFAGKDAIVKAKGYIKNIKPTFYENHFYSKYINWENNFSDVRRIFAGGEIIIPHTHTRLSGGVESVQNYIYYRPNDFSGEDGNQSKYIIAQSGKNIQVISLRLDQNLRAGIFHWDNQVVYQLSSEKDVLPLPALSLYSNAYMLTNVFKVLTFQLGIDAHFHTKYYAPSYDPVMLQFYTQQEVKTGGFPISTAYLNINLKNTRFFLMMYNVAESIGNSEYFSLPHYPVNPMTFKFGLSWDFNN